MTQSQDSTAAPSSTGAVSAAHKPDHTYSNHGMSSGAQNSGNDRMSYLYDRGPGSAPQDVAARQARILAEIRSAEAMFSRR
ncbi:hypothetical protein VFPPC_13561 [Pochonia chlamydosporia 170]|uniref:Uncharacterized protein n=1 Tax=Pochonia chlamydosporia 170 TaxID=1380566 RepID=A0A179FPX2_METCM|nr:hypothetical protein VFPPC_13561 [Pochonia chlamydosporia 170]OAQ67676.1 hypothetical protein VFPPC_13561 [Pochonia chlamydosporia 170]